MRMSNAGKIELMGHEGIALSKYYDSVGCATIGPGLTVTEIPDLASWPLNKTLTLEQCLYLFSQGLVSYERAVSAGLKVSVSQAKFDALVSWCYNVGTGWVPKAQIFRDINANADANTVGDDFMHFVTPPEITGRRNKERLLYVTEQYQNKGKILLFPVSSSGYPVYSRGRNIDASALIPSTPYTQTTYTPDQVDSPQSITDFLKNPVNFSFPSSNDILKNINDFLTLNILD